MFKRFRVNVSELVREDNNREGERWPAKSMRLSYPGKGSSQLASGSGIILSRSPISIAMAVSANNHVAATPTIFAHHSITGSQQPYKSKEKYFL